MARVRIERCLTCWLLAGFLGSAALAEGQSVPLAFERGGGVRLDVQSGEDITEKFQAAIDRVAGRGGRIEIPPGTYLLSATIDVAGSLPRFNRASTTPMFIEGNGAVLEWTGPDEGAIIDLPGLAFSSLKNIHLRGAEGRKWDRVVGFRYRDGIERKNHGGKNNLFQGLVVEHVGVGVEVGGLFGPDLVGGTFLNTQIRHVRIGFRFLGQNVTSMQLWNPVVEEYRQAGIQIQAFGGRVIRATENDFRPEQKNPRIPVVLMDPDGMVEIFQKDLPDWMTAPDVRYPTSWVKGPDGAQRLMAGGGSLEVTIFNLQARTSHTAAWAIDTNWAWARVYTARVLGKGGVFRSTEKGSLGHYSNMLMDVTAPDQPAGGVAVSFPGSGPLYVTGGYFAGPILVGGETTVFAMGPRFAPGLGFEQIPETRGAIIHGLSAAWRRTVEVPAGTTRAEVLFADFWSAQNSSYQIELLPGFPADGIWIEEKSPRGFHICWFRPPDENSRIDVVVSRKESSP